MKVAGYSFGMPGTDKYELLEFWTKDRKRADVKYAYGKDRKAIKLLYVGTDQIKGNSCFKVRFTNNYQRQETGIKVSECRKGSH